MFKETIIEILKETWPMILICCFILVSLRLVYLYKNKRKLILYKELISLVFVIYVMCLFHVVTFQDVSWSTSNFTLFKEMLRYEFGSKLFIKNVIGNALMFIPYGLFSSYFLKVKKPYLILILSLFTSVSIEFVQLKIGRVFDIDDVILNVLGGLLGYILYFIINKLKEKLPSRLKRPLTYSIMILLGIIALIVYLMR